MQKYVLFSLVSLVEKLMGKIQSAGKMVNSASECRGKKFAVLIATFSQFKADINITQILRNSGIIESWITPDSDIILVQVRFNKNVTKILI